MKKSLFIIIILITLLSSMPVYADMTYSAYYPDMKNDFSITVNDEYVVDSDEYGSPIYPFFIEGNLYLPADVFAYVMGMEFITNFESNNIALYNTNTGYESTTQEFDQDTGFWTEYFNNIDMDAQMHIVSVDDGDIEENRIHYLYDDGEYYYVSYTMPYELINFKYSEKGIKLHDMINQDYINSFFSIVIFWYWEIFINNPLLIIMIIIIIILSLVSVIYKRRTDQTEEKQRVAYMLKLEQDVKDLNEMITKYKNNTGPNNLASEFEESINK